MRLFLSTFLFLTFSVLFSTEAISQEIWKSLSNYSGVEVSYTYKLCSPNDREQTLVLFRFTNTTDQTLQMFWSRKEFRNNICYNCDVLNDSEHKFEIILSPGETVESDGTSLVNNALYVFSHFQKLVPGMSDSKLTSFEFVNVLVEEVE